jgi:hypothetical protein
MGDFQRGGLGDSFTSDANTSLELILLKEEIKICLGTRS